MQEHNTRRFIYKVENGKLEPLGFINEFTSEVDVRRAEPFFFQKVPGRKRETVSFHRGQPIVRHTANFAIGNGPRRGDVRRTVVYLFLPDGYHVDQVKGEGKATTVHLTSEISGIAAAERLIDNILDSGISDSTHRWPSKVIKVPGGKGFDFNVRLVRKFDHYGLDFKLVHSEDEPMVEFYDTRHMHTQYGQFVSRYYLTEAIKATQGIDLQGDVDSWKVDAACMTKVHKWLAKHPFLPPPRE